MCRLHWNKKKAHQKQKGAELVELALVLPLFLLLLIGIIEFGRAYNAYENVIHATREGVRAAVADCLTGGNCAPGTASALSDNEVRNRIRAHLQAINIDISNPNRDIVITKPNVIVTGFLDGGGISYNASIQSYNVQVNYSYSFLFLGPIMKLVVPNSRVGSNGLILSATVEMRDERSPV